MLGKSKTRNLRHSGWKHSASRQLSLESLEQRQLLAELAEANCLIVVDEDTEELATGDWVDVMFLAQRG